ncbi:MAG: hypothetical protein A3G83_15325 [Betaproteobacteria bacterium RIFCSPLOWO2_12_FULL_68_20]|nr:MAG: hypothetical protein A3G83_15325 [Betaproteobacteria bacterium RIFCSPLOWO2_12_FULL_68_20]
MFEIVLFYQALWLQAGDPGRTAVLGGFGAAAVLLAATGWGIFKYSLRLPVGLFFAATSILLAAMAVAFTGQGIAALQEAGAIGASRFDFDALPLLGVYPTGEGLAAQAIALALVALGFRAARRRAVAQPA